MQHFNLTVHILILFFLNWKEVFLIKNRISPYGLNDIFNVLIILLALIKNKSFIFKSYM